MWLWSSVSCFLHYNGNLIMKNSTFLSIKWSTNSFWYHSQVLSLFVSVQFSSVAQSCLILCDPMDCSMPGFPVHHQLPELTQTQDHQIGDAIQLSHPLLSPSPPALNPSQHQVFSKESVLHIRWPKYWSFSFSISPSNEYSGLISLRKDWFDLLEGQRSCL